MGACIAIGGNVNYYCFESMVGLKTGKRFNKILIEIDRNLIFSLSTPGQIIRINNIVRVNIKKT